LGILSLLIGNSLSIKGTMQLFIVFNFSYKAKTVRGNMDHWLLFLFSINFHDSMCMGSTIKETVIAYFGIKNLEYSNIH
jgi:hypothetical protein